MAKLENFLQDFSMLIIEEALEAKRARNKSENEKDRLFEAGKLLAYHSVLSLLQHQAKVFRIPLKSIGLADVVPERDFV
jgi:hypothetical protein